MMKRLALLAAPILCLAGPALAADLGPYPERETYLQPPVVHRKIIKETYVPPPVVHRKIVEHHHYYHEAPTVYREKRVYIEPRVYEEPIYKERLYPRRFAYAYQDWRPHHFFPRHRYWPHRGHRHWW
jgi:hypothetical protein